MSRTVPPNDATFIFEFKIRNNYKKLLKAALFDPLLSQHHVSTDLRKVSQAV